MAPDKPPVHATAMLVEVMLESVRIGCEGVKFAVIEAEGVVPEIFTAFTTIVFVWLVRPEKVAIFIPWKLHGVAVPLTVYV